MSDLVRQHLLTFLDGKGAHAPFDQAVADFPASLRGLKPGGAPHSAWQLLEHLRIAQRDLLDFSRDPDYVSPKWPDSYWPTAEVPATDRAWDESVAEYQTDLAAMKALIADESRDLFEPYPSGSGKPLFRNALILADHTSYHVGQLMYLRKILGL